MKSKILEEQLKSIFNSTDISKEIQELNLFLINEKNFIKFKSLSEKLSNFNKFVDLVDLTYSKFEQKSEKDISKIELTNKSESEKTIELDSLLNTLDDGYLIIGRDGSNIELASSMARKILGRDPTGDQLVDIISIPQETKDSFKDWLKMVFMEAIPFKDLARLAPKGFYFGNRDKLIEVKFKPIRNTSDGSLSKIAMILSDNSGIFEAEKIIGEQKLFTDMVIKYLNDKPNFIRLIQATRETADTLNSWNFNNNNDIQEQAKLLSERLHNLKLELNNLSMYSLGYKIHQMEDEIVTFCKITSNVQECENLIHLLGQEMLDSLNSFLNKYRHIFVFDNKPTQTKEISVESIYKFCAELLRMGLTDLLDYYIEEIVAVPFASLFAPIEARIYAQSLSQDSTIEYTLLDPKKIKVIPEFYSYFFEQLVPIFNFIVNHKNETGPSACKIQIDIDVIDGVNKSKILVSIRYIIDTKSQSSVLISEREDSLITALNQ